MQRGLLGLALVCAVCWVGASAIAAAPRRAAPVRALQACPFPILDTVNAPLAADRADADAEDAGPDDEDEDEDAAPASITGPGWLTADGCIYLGGTIDASLEMSAPGGRLFKLLGRLPNRTTMSPKSTVQLRHLSRTDWGDLTTRFSMETVPGSASISQASIALGPAVAGLETSFFDAWSADEFSFRALASSQSPTLFGWTARPTDALAISVSAEDQTFRRVTVSGYAGQAAPDLVTRLRWYAKPFDLTLAAASHETRLTRAEENTLHGVAALASLKVFVPTKEDGSYVIAQAAWSRNALGYLGINTANSVFAQPIGGIFSASVSERGTGWNAALVGYWQIAPAWSSAAFATVVSLDIPRAGGTGRVTSYRTAVNLAWQPAEDFSITVEAGYGRTESGITLLPSSHRTSLIVSMSRSF